MTGFGRCALSTDLGVLSVEIRSVNHRTLDLKIRGRDLAAQAEHAIAKLIRSRLTRGSLAASVELHSGESAPATGKSYDQPSINARPFQLALEFVQEFAKQHNLGTPSLSDVVAAAHLCQEPQAVRGLREIPQELLRQVSIRAVDALLSMRAAEGESLSRDLKCRLSKLERLTDELEALVSAIPGRLRERIRTRVEAFIKPDVAFDDGRLEHEIAIACERADVTEELVRLRTHLKGMRALLEQPDAEADATGPVGRKLEFWLQEIGREINTLAAKTPDANVSPLVVAAKAELEKMREQAQNVE